MISAIQTSIALPTVLDCPLRWEVNFAAPVSDEVLDQLSALTRNFFRLAGLGAYVVETAAPENASFSAINEQRLSNGITWDCQAAATDWRIAQVFRNILVMFSQLHHPVQYLSIHAPTALPTAPLALPMLGTESMEQTYPPRSQRLNFKINYKPPRSARTGRRVEIEFAQHLTDSNARRIIEWLELWASISLGAYARDENDAWSGECAIFDALPDIMDDYTIEMPIEKFGAPEVAWNSLFNLSGRISVDIAVIGSIFIE